MRERVYIISEDAPGWRLELDEESLGRFSSRDQAFAAAAAAARASRAAGDYAWIKLRQPENAFPE